MRVLVTGAAGRIGREMVDELEGSHELVLVDRRGIPGRDVIIADLSEPAGELADSAAVSEGLDWERAFAGVDALLHLAAEADPGARWEEVLRHNVQATWNVLRPKVPAWGVSCSRALTTPFDVSNVNARRRAGMRPRSAGTPRRGR